MRAATKIIVVDDQMKAGNEFNLAHKAAERGGVVLPQLTFWEPVGALARIKGAGGRAAPEWTDSHLLLVDCRDRDSVTGEGRFRSAFFVLDMLDALRTVSRRGGTIPRVVAYSSYMNEPMVRAVLGEFLVPRVEVQVDRNNVGLGYRLASVPDPRRSTGVLWAMFGRSELLLRLGDVVLGGRDDALSPPPPGDPVWNEVLPTSCLASFHLAVRDRHPDEWTDLVIKGIKPEKLDASVRRSINRLAVKYLEPNPARGGLDYWGYVELLRSIAVPDYT